jgi:SAM-dependent methyltransferase
MKNLEELHSKLKKHLEEQNIKWNHFIYSKQDGFYQGLDEIEIKGSRSSEKRFEEYNIEKYLSKDKAILDIGSNCGFFSIFISRFVKNVVGVEINPYLVSIASDTQKYLNITNAAFLSSSFEEFQTNKKFDIICSFANDSTIDDNTKFSFKEYIKKIKSLLTSDGLLIFESQAIDSMIEEQFSEKFSYLEKTFLVLEKKKINSEYPKNVPLRDFLILKNQT